MSRDSFAARVRRGVEFLDETVNDDWHLKIDLYSLDLEDGAHCVLGQLWQDKLPAGWASDDAFNAAKDDLALTDEIERSFNIDPGIDEWEAYHWLTIRWRQAIRNKIEETARA